MCVFIDVYISGRPRPTAIKALGLVVSDKKIFFKVFPIYACVKHVTPGLGPFLAPGFYFEQLGRVH